LAVAGWRKEFPYRPLEFFKGEIEVLETDKIKEEIGWLKVVFGLLVAIGVSLIGWAA